MQRYVIRRLLLMIPTLFFVALITFTLAHLTPGGPFDRDENKALPSQIQDNLARYYGLDRPLPEQFALFLGNAVRLDFGTSIRRDRPVVEVIGQGLPVSMQLGIQALLLALLIAIPLGVVSALKQNTFVDYGGLFLATIGTTIPSFVLAIIFIFVFGVGLRWLPFIGWGDGLDVRRMIMPTVILALPAAAFLARITRASMLEALSQDYVRTARSKGLHERTIIVRHALRNALIPVATILGPATAGLVTGSFIIESLFSIPGVGRITITSIQARDYPVIMATTMMYSSLVVLANLSVDLIYGVLDPRIKVDAT